MNDENFLKALKLYEKNTSKQHVVELMVKYLLSLANEKGEIENLDKLRIMGLVQSKPFIIR